jgi:hypothetical protein
MAVRVHAFVNEPALEVTNSGPSARQIWPPLDKEFFPGNMELARSGVFFSFAEQGGGDCLPFGLKRLTANRAPRATIPIGRV